MARIESTSEFEADLNSLREVRDRVDSAISGLKKVLAGNPTSYEEIPGLTVRVAVTRPYPGVEYIQVAYRYDESSDTITLLRAEIA